MTPDDPLTDEALSALAHRAAQWPDAPPALVRAAVALFATRARPWWAGAGEAMREVLAALRFDSAAQPALAAGMRGAGADARQLLFSAEGRDVDLRLSPAGAGLWRLHGQVLGPDEQGLVLLRADGADSPQQQVALDALGEFVLDSVAPGHWQLALRLADQTIVLPVMHLADPVA